jgi:hypothetical protein
MFIRRGLLLGVLFGFFLAAFALALPSPVFAASRPADCTLTVNGKSYIGGLCELTSDDSGSFSIYGDRYWAMVNVENGKGEASFNAAPYAPQAETELGKVHQVGGCWEGPKVRICALAMNQSHRDAMVATRPKGLSISPAYEGYLCVSVPGYRYEPGAVLVMDRCDQFVGLRQRVFHLSEGKISFEGNPGLCIDARSVTGVKELKLVLDDCARVAIHWTFNKDANEIRSNTNLCWDIVFGPGQKKKADDWTSAMFAHPCNRDPDKNGKFELSVD